MQNKQEKRAYLLRRLAEAGWMGVRIEETTPKLGGFRQRDAQRLVDEGLAEWTSGQRTFVREKSNAQQS